MKIIDKLEYKLSISGEILAKNEIQLLMICLLEPMQFSPTNHHYRYYLAD